MDEKDTLSNLQTAKRKKQKAMKQDYEEKLYETAKEVAKDLPLAEAARIFTCCLIRDTKPTLDATSITLEMTYFDIEVKLKFPTEGKQNRTTTPYDNE